MKREAVHLIVSGRVQGVGYRWYTQQKAHQFGITGTVENLDNGEVQVRAAGSPEKLKKFINELRKGPSFSLVQDIRIEKIDTPTESKDFSIVSSRFRW